jgi:hypothetical protein
VIILGEFFKALHLPRALAGLVSPRANEDEVLRNSYCEPGPPRGGLGPLCMEAGPPGDLCACASQGGPDFPSHRGGGPVPPRVPGEAAAKTSTATCLVAPSLLREASPTTALNAGGWGARARDKA